MLSWLFEQALQGDNGARHVVLSVLNGLLEVNVNPWLRNQAGVEIQQIELTENPPTNGTVQVRLTFHRKNPN